MFRQLVTSDDVVTLIGPTMGLTKCLELRTVVINRAFSRANDDVVRASSMYVERHDGTIPPLAGLSI